MVTREIAQPDMDEIPSSDVESCPDKVVATGYGLRTGIAGQQNSFKLDAREAGFGDFDVVIKGASRAAIEYIEEDEALYKIKYFVELPGMYQIEIKYDTTHVSGSPFAAKVIDASSVENQSIGKTDDTMTNSVESFSTLNESTISEEDTQSINSGGGKALPVIASIQTPSGRVIKGACMQNASGKVVVNFPREETGIYTVTLKHQKSGKLLPGSPYEVSVQAKEVKTTMTAYGTGLKEAGLETTNCFTLFGSKGIDINNVCILAIGPCSTKMKVFQNDWDSIDILYEVKRSGYYYFYVHENGKDIPGSPFTVHAKGTTSQAFTSYVASVWHGEESADIRAVTNLMSPDGHVLSHSVARKGKHLLEVRFLPAQNGIYELVIFKGHTDLEQTFFIKIDKLPTADQQAFVITGDISTAFIDKSAQVLISSVVTSLKSFSVEFNGPGMVDIEQKRSGKLTNSCTIEYTGHVPGKYSMSVKYDGFHISGSPFTIDMISQHSMLTHPAVFKNETKNIVPNAALCVATREGLHQAMLDSSNSFQVDTSKAGDGILMAGFHNTSSSTITEVNCKHIAENLFDVHYKIGKIGIYKLSVLWSGQNIPGSPFEIHVRDENNNSSLY